MSEIKLNRRYPESRPEDITDAYTRGVEVGRAMRMDESEKLREEFDKMDKWHSAELIAAMKENAKLRQLVRDMWHDARLLDANSHMDGMRLSDSKAEDYMRRMRELGVEV